MALELCFYAVRYPSSSSRPFVGEKMRKFSLSSRLRIVGRRAEKYGALVLQKRSTDLRLRWAGPDGDRRKRVIHLCAKSSAILMESVGGNGGNEFPPDNGPDEEYSMSKLLVDLRNGGGPEDGRFVFPPTLTARQRRRGHEIAERLGLGHVRGTKGVLQLGDSQPLNDSRSFARLSIMARDALVAIKYGKAGVYLLFYLSFCNGTHVQLLDLEEAASSANFMMEQPLQSWRILEAQGLLLHNALITEREAVSFGRERWVLEDGVGVERAGHVSRFSQRARPGMPVCLAEKDLSGMWVAAKGEPPGRVAWSRGRKICFVFDHPPSPSEQITSASFLLVPDSSSFQRMRSVLRDDGDLGEKGADSLLSTLLGSGIKAAFSSTPLPLRASDNDYAEKKIQNKQMQRNQLFDEGLNMEQCAAVKLCMEPGKSPVVLIHGPFGTGKTRTLVEVVRQQVKAGYRVLVCAASNAAVDNMVHGLLAADPSLPLARAGLTERVSTSLAAYTMEALQDAQPEAAVAKRLRKEAYAMQLTAEKWTRAASGGEKRRNAKKEVNILFKDARRLEKMCAAAVLQRTKILCGTLTGFASALWDLGNAEDTRFDRAVIDEASQAITPALLLLLPYLNHPEDESPRVPLFVMAGDHQQLPPTVLSGDHDDKGGGLEATLFEELMERDGGGLGTRIEDLVSNRELWENAKLSILSNAHALASGVEDNIQPSDSFVPGHISVALRQQYRMPAQLMAFPSAAFYGAQLITRHCGVTVTLPHDEASILQTGLLLEVIDTAGAGFEDRIGEALPSSVRSSIAVEVFSTSNPGQAKLTARVVHELLKSASYSASDVGVVTPYSAQVMLLRQLMVDEVEAGLEIDSVDAYQGREKEVIVVDAVRSNTEGTIGFLGDFHRLNVALTRACHKLVVIGDSATLSIDPVWAVFFEWVSEYREKPLTGIRYQSVFELPTEGGY